MQKTEKGFQLHEDFFSSGCIEMMYALSDLGDNVQFMYHVAKNEFHTYLLQSVCNSNTHLF